MLLITHGWADKIVKMEKKPRHLTNFFEFGYENNFLFFKKIVVYFRLGISILKQLLSIMYNLYNWSF